MPRPPRLDEESDAVLKPGAESTWITVGDFSIYIKVLNAANFGEDGVQVDIYAREFEDCDALTTCQAFDSDVEEMQEEKDLEVD